MIKTAEKPINTGVLRNDKSLIHMPWKNAYLSLKMAKIKDSGVWEGGLYPHYTPILNYDGYLLTGLSSIFYSLRVE